MWVIGYRHRYYIIGTTTVMISDSWSLIVECRVL